MQTSAPGPDDPVGHVGIRATATPQAPAPPASVGTRFIWLVTLAQGGVFVAFITPLAISLAIKVEQIAPGQTQNLGYITGAGALAVVLTGPFLGIASDRTRTRIGRRRPFMIGGTLLGLAALVVMATATSIPMLMAGWVMAQLTWGQALGNLQTITADMLPEHQRGKVAGLVGFATQIAPVLGVGLAGGLSGDHLLLFLVPGAIGAVLVGLFVVFIHEPDSRGIDLGHISVLEVLRKLVFDPRRYPDFAWVWVGRFCFYFGLTFATTFTAFYFAHRLGITLGEVAGLIALLSLGNLVATSAGALGGGFLSDRLRRRRAFVLVGSLFFAAGCLVTAAATSLVPLCVGALLSAVGIGTFAAVDQALVLDVLPERETEAGRYMGIVGFATSVPQAAAPLVAPLVLAVGAGGANYPLLYGLAAVVTVIGGIAVLRVRSVR